MFLKLKNYIQEASAELLHKVTWPTWKELQSSALIVLVASLIIALIVYAMDASFSSVITWFYKTVA